MSLTVDATSMAIATSMLVNASSSTLPTNDFCQPSKETSLSSLVALVVDEVIARFGIFGVVYLFAIFYITLVCVIQVVDMYQFIWDFYWMQLQRQQQQQQEERQRENGPLSKAAAQRYDKARIRQCLSTSTYAESKTTTTPSSKHVQHETTEISSQQQLQQASCCPICLSDFQASDLVTRLDRTKCPGCCGHAFHDSCLLQWLDVSPSCPHCRHELFPQTPPFSILRRQEQQQPAYESPMSSRATSISARMELASLQLEHTILTAMSQFGEHWGTYT